MSFTRKGTDYIKYVTGDVQRIVSYEEGAELYGVSATRYKRLSRLAKANMKIRRQAVVNLDLLDAYLNVKNQTSLKERNDEND